ncbi:hypothetical protein HH214_09515 [Mucilaginibacter robiniae]|uniref:Uncharacterized protein n=1 Tax=Mucilaginibacter robiniae TaxID=2728022 RepID=A0A7L5E363_9SPHI|nr:hypothetical protein [Mucilaginibacter robiniae]QJD96094.1 hypothetical protein HH214_09515 [Mucilaginibacter robiniae]
MAASFRQFSDWSVCHGIAWSTSPEYLESAKTGLRYTYNSGTPNTDNPKLAARHYLQAIDKTESLLDKHTKELETLREQIPQMEKLIGRPFDREAELQQLKSELTRLEQEIAAQIRGKQQQHPNEPLATEQEREAVIIPLREPEQHPGPAETAAGNFRSREAPAEQAPVRKHKSLKIN